MNRIDKTFAEKKKNIFSVYFTAGHPTLNSTKDIIIELERNGADMIEIGMPFSDPLADGPVIQQSSQKALENGMSLKLLFEQLKDIRQHVKIPLVLMGYLNPVMHYGVEKFCQKAAEIGIDGIILPDLPFAEYELLYKATFEKYNLHNIFLITPQTSDQRLSDILKTASGFVYMVASSSTTGAKASVEQDQMAYFRRIHEKNIAIPRIIGFGISNKATFENACQYANGAIIGSAFVKMLDSEQDVKKGIATFCKSIVG